MSDEPTPLRDLHAMMDQAGIAPGNLGARVASALAGLAAWQAKADELAVERDALRQAMRDLAEQIREAENVPRSPLTRTMWTNHGPDADVLSADAVADAILATIGGGQ